MRSTSVVRVYSVVVQKRRYWYACLRRGGRRVLLAKGKIFVAGDSAIAGSWVAWTTWSGSSGGQVFVENLVTRRRRKVPFFSSAILNQIPDGIAVSASGAVAMLRATTGPSYRLDVNPTWTYVVGFAGASRPALAVAGVGGVDVLRAQPDGTLSPAVRAIDQPSDAPGLGRSRSAVADLNGDGNSDFVAAATDGVLIYAGRDDGTFAAASRAELAGGASAVAVGDLNGDGHVDILALTAGQNKQASRLWLLAGRGDLAFAPAVQLASPASGAGGVSVGDADGDGRSDVLVSGYPVLSLYLGNGDGTLQAPIAVAESASTVEITDLNRDAIPDLLPDSNGSIALGAGHGTFQASNIYTAVSLVAGDVNGDGIVDLVSTDDGGINTRSAGAAAVSAALGRADGTYSVPQRYYLEPGYPAVALADVTGDGKPDIVVANTGSVDVTLLANRGDGTFGPTYVGDDVLVFDSSGLRELAHAAKVEVRSLRFDGATLSWTANGTPSTAMTS